MQSEVLTPKIFALSQSKELGKSIADAYGMELGKFRKNMFSDGEFQPHYEESVRGCTVFIIQSTFPK